MGSGGDGGARVAAEDKTAQVACGSALKPTGSTRLAKDKTEASTDGQQDEDAIKKRRVSQTGQSNGGMQENAEQEQQHRQMDEPIEAGPATPSDELAGANQRMPKMQVRTSQVDQDELLRLVQVEAMELPDLGLVVSGISGRFPKSDSVNEFETNLRLGEDMINDQDNSRFTCGLWGLPPRAGRLKDLSRFDYEFFGFSQEWANYVDFQLRILYEVVYESILDAGLNPASLRGTNTGVFFGLHCNEFENAMADDPAFKTNGYYAQFAVKIAQYFDFRGITLTFDAACASGFVGLHNAVEALKDGIVDQAIVCSSNIPVHPTGSFIFYQMQMLSPTGYSRFLDSRADGYVKSEACVSLLLQRQQVAKRNYATFLATMTSVDGFKPEGITFPSDKSQETLIRQTKEMAGVSTNHVEYLEAHGTGTPAGDPQEARAISNVYFSDQPDADDQTDDIQDDAAGEQKKTSQQNYNRTRSNEQVKSSNRDKRLIGPLLVGSVKTNMGHSEAASGLCALVKVALMLENEIIYKNLHFDQPNTNIEPLMDGRLKFVAEPLKLKSRIIPLSCYGFGGSNVHVICRSNKRESIPQLGVNKHHLITTGGLPRLVLMFGRGEHELGTFFDNLLDESNPNTRNCLTDDYLSLLDALSSDKIDRMMNYRGFCLLDARQRQQLARSVQRCDLAPVESSVAIAAAATDRGRRLHHQEAAVRRCHLAFSGLGCQWPGMATGLARVKPFWSTVERLAQLLEPYTDEGLLNIVDFYLASCAGKSEQQQSARQSKPASPKSLCESFVAIVAYQVALINVIRDTLQVQNLGALVGHSLGEVTCAYAAGLFDEREAIMVAYQLGKTLDELQPVISGKMVALVGLDYQEVAKVVELHRDVYESLRVSCLNGPNSVTISGRSHEVDEFLLVEMELYRNSMMVFEVNNDVALHNSFIMDRPEVRAKLKQSLERVMMPLTDYDRTKTSWVSTFLVSGRDQDDQIAKQANVDYFVEMLCKPIDMIMALGQLEPDSIIYELSPSNSLESQIIQLRYTPPVRAPSSNQSRKSSSSSMVGVNGQRNNSRRASFDQSKRKFHYVKCMQKNLDADKQIARLLSSFGELYQAGATFNLANLYTAQTGHRVQFPVRRQTPSISSLFRWDHSASLFVPRYPIQFSKSSAKCELPIDMVQDRDKYLAGHCIDGRVLYPATGYLLLVWRVFSFTKRRIYDACFQDIERELMPVEFRNVRLLRAVILGQRLAQLYVHFEEATGKFEVKEGGSVVVEGYAMSPEENPTGLLYENVRERLAKERQEQQENGTDKDEMMLSKDDVYKQFRVHGYDYGESFQCIESSSFDGRISRIKFNGHFVSLTDSILQSIFLTITQCAPSGSLFLPTRFDYVRFQPDVIVKRLHEVGMSIDQSDGSLNTKAKREMMAKIMQRDSGAPDAELDNVAEQQEDGLDGDDDVDQQEQQQQPACIFETYCDTQTGIIITDGIEMRGIKASPAPRRIDNNEVLLESYQFVRDTEHPVDDERLTRFEQVVRPYASACDSMSLELLMRLFGLDSTKQLNGLIGDINNRKVWLMAKRELEAYKRQHLECLYDQTEVNRPEVDKEVDTNSNQNEVEDSALNTTSKTNAKATSYDIKKNGRRTLMSLLDQLLSLNKLSLDRVRDRVQENKVHLLRDLLRASYSSERFVRPLIETVIENSCIKKAKLRLLEINLDDGIMRSSLHQLIQQIEPSLSIDYALAHPDPQRLHGSQTSGPASTTTTGVGGSTTSAPPASTNKTYTLKEGNVEGLFRDHTIKGLDLVVFKDLSCYRPVESPSKNAQLSQTLAALSQSLKPGGYCMVLMRRQLTVAERIMLALSEPESIGLNANELQPSGKSLDKLAHQIEQINPQLEQRCSKLLEAADELQRLHLVSEKSDQHGCLMLLFRRVGAAQDPLIGGPVGDQAQAEQVADSTQQQQQQLQHLPAEKVERMLLRVQHDKLDWLDELKNNFRQEEEDDRDGQAESGDSGQNEQIVVENYKDNSNELLEHQHQNESAPKPRSAPKRVWLCAVATKQNPINGLIGMMQSLRKELGSTDLRCYYDEFSFAHSDEPVSLDQIEASDRFQEALKRDHIWNCVDSRGQLGAFRHFTINEYLSYEECLCVSQKRAAQAIEAASTFEGEPTKNAPTSSKSNKTDLDDCQKAVAQSGAYANNLIRGDLSSFAWFEAPLKHLTHEQRQDQLVKVAYSALNFRDIMLATGRLPLDAISVKLAMSDCLLGLEFSGHDARGRRVMGMVEGRGIATHVLCPPETSIKIELPDELDLREAATIPVVYATAIMSLIYRGRMQRGETILIHAGSGGVGQAAIRLALHFGLDVFTTVGSQDKRDFLLEEFGPSGLQPDRIFNSRTDEFEHKILAVTRGKGVDLVLNSLADDKLQASLNCLADGGRFLEIGKYDMSVDTRLELLKLETNKSFHGILVDKLFDVDEMGNAFKNQLRLVLKTLQDGLRAGFIKPIKHKVFKRHEIEEAFRFMATGKHIGKVLVEIDPSSGVDKQQHQVAGSDSAKVDSKAFCMESPLKAVPRFQLSPTKSFIVTGGLGGFGLELCKWLALQGARQLVLTSRSGLKTGYQRATLRRLEAGAGVKILIITEREADASTPEGARRLLQIARELAPSQQVGGIFHLAMVLRDTLLQNMTREDFELVFRPKVATCLCLDEAVDSMQLELDYFVAFSSITSGKGNAGQANYAYANSCLERVCERRRARGCHGLAIQWGAIGDVGVAYENLGGNEVVIGGTIPQRMPSCLATLAKLLCSPFATCLSVLPVNRNQDALGEKGDLVGAIMHVLGIKDPSKVSEEASLGDLGLDSLMAVEIRQYIEREHDITLNIQEIRALTIARIREISESSEAKPQSTSGGGSGGQQATGSGSGATGQKAPGADERKQASSYGKQPQTGGSGGQNVASSGQPAKRRPNAGNKFNQAQTASHNMMAAVQLQQHQSRLALLDKNMVSSFVPALELPADDFCHLNSTSSEVSPSNPIFFLPPIHGKFDKLESVCRQIKRPCIGLNWTRKLGQAQSVDEAVEIYVKQLEQTDWDDLFSKESNASGASKNQSKSTKTKTTATNGKQAEIRERTVDLVGYSFGATIAFELMVAIERRQALHNNLFERRLSNGLDTVPALALSRQRNLLKAGRLVLLDGSPKQIELGSQYLADLTRKQPMKLADKVDELLMVYLIANSRKSSLADEQQLNNKTAASNAGAKLQSQTGGAWAMDLASVLRELKSRSDLRAKVEFASDKLARLLQTTVNTKQQNGNNNKNSQEQAHHHQQQQAAQSLEVTKQSIFHAMEAFLRRYELIDCYKAKWKLATDCTLIRAEKLYLKQANQTAANKYNEDLDLTSVVAGRVDLFIMSGDHETFLAENELEIGRIIAGATLTTPAVGGGGRGGQQLVVAQRAEPAA